ncbi:DNA-3-methyladenine glycosylase [Bernardetia sp. Wsw4-3y2]|uniref:DNA-3-methyladenine glycosylase n=1 Tax=unclassified Bernardetia TaxID=2647129 RepID=UPI0030D2B9D4
MLQAKKLPKSFYTRSDVVQIARELLGKYLVTDINDKITVGKIVETEAYCGAIDKACHAHLNKKTERTKIMFEEGGVAYVYLVYGMYKLFNIVTNEYGKADAVLIRALEPIEGVETMLERRKMEKIKDKDGKLKLKRNLTAGPGVLSIAMGIDLFDYGQDLTENRIWIEDRREIIEENEIIASARVNIDYAQEDKDLPWRFRVKNNKWTSPAK